jgi:hypothetical protein
MIFHNSFLRLWPKHAYTFIKNISMSPPDLVIFDIDATLLIPSIYHSPDNVHEGLYDDQLLTLFLANPKYQVALASFNESPTGLLIYGGRRLGRTILDLQHPTGDSRQNVQDEFIQAWQFPTAQQMDRHGKNGIRAYWVTTGLTRNNIHTFVAIGNRVQFSTQEGQISQCNDLQVFFQYIYKQPQSANTSPVYSTYEI